MCSHRFLKNISVATMLLPLAALGQQRSAPQPFDNLSSTCEDLNQSIRRDIAGGQLEKAERAASAAVADDARPLQPTCAAQLFGDVATAMQIAGQLKEAEGFAVRALAYLDKSSTPDDPAYSAPLYVLAAVQLEEGRMGRARETFRRMQRIHTSAPSTRALVHGTGAVLFEIEGKWEEAETEYKKAAAAFASAGRENSGDTAAILTGLASLYLDEGRFGDALDTVQRALKTLDRASDAVPLDRIKALNLRGVIMARQDQWGEAEKDLFEAFCLVRRRPRVDPIEIEAVVANYATALRKQHRKREAQSVLAWGAALRGRDPTWNHIVDIAELAPKPARKAR